MSHKCDSCEHAFFKATELFQHIQTSCLSYYKNNPKSWSNLLSNLSPDENAETQSATPPAEKLKSSQPNSSSSSEPSSLSSKSEDSQPKKETPFCIMFRAQNLKSGKTPKNVHMTVPEYFYAQVDGQTYEEKKTVRRNNCYSCGKTLKNNLRFMSHLRHKVVNEWEKTRAAEDLCEHCFRYYDSPFLLQCHLENVHGSQPALSTCRICELHFPSERIFLFHMKDKHVYNEMPYRCKLCHFRSSFYSDVIKHFRKTHNDTLALMCPFCLNIQHNSNSFLKHAITHIKKNLQCPRCRLQFINPKERMLHLEKDHVTKDVKSKAKSCSALSRCQIFVRVAAKHSSEKKLSPPSENKDVLDVETPSTPSSDATPTFDTTPTSDVKLQRTLSGADLPAYLCPLKQSNGLRIVRFPDKAEASQDAGFQCCECKKDLEPTSESFLSHFGNMYECRWCVYVTACELASRNHVLNEHADSEMREQLTSNVDEEMNDAVSLPNTNEEELLENSFTPVLETPIENAGLTVVASESPKKEYAKRKGSPDANSLLKKRRKQENPMRFPDEADDIPGGSKEINQEMVTELNTSTSTAETPTPPVIKKGMKAKIKTRVNLTREGWSKYFQQNNLNTSMTERLILQNKIGLPTMVSSSTLPSQLTLEPKLPPLQPLKPKKLEEAVLAQPAVPQKTKASILVGAPLNISVPPNTKSDIVEPCSVSSNFLTNLIQMTPITTPTLQTSMAPALSKSGPIYQFKIIPTMMKSTPASPAITGTKTTHNYILPKPAPLTTVTSIMHALNVQSICSTPKPVVINPSEYKMPQPPYNLRCLYVTPSSLLIRWEPPISGPVTSYKVVFQGSGAPTVQMLPKEQTLVRLVGLRSNTMYIIRVHTLHEKMSSPYSFIFQRTKKLRKTQNMDMNTKEENKDSQKSNEGSVNDDDDDVIMVMDNEDEEKDEASQLSAQTDSCPDKSCADQSNPAKTGLPAVDSIGKLAPKSNPVKLVKLPEFPKQIDFHLDTSNPVAGKEPVKRWVFKPKKDLDLNIIDEVKLHLEQEKIKKKSLIDEILKGMKKNKESKQYIKASIMSNMINKPEANILYSTSDKPEASNTNDVEVEGIVYSPLQSVDNTVEISSANDAITIENTEATIVNADHGSMSSSEVPGPISGPVQETVNLSVEDANMTDTKSTESPSCNALLHKLLDFPLLSSSLEKNDIITPVLTNTESSIEQMRDGTEQKCVETAPLDSLAMEEININNEDPGISLQSVVSLGPVIDSPKNDETKVGDRIDADTNQAMRDEVPLHAKELPKMLPINDAMEILQTEAFEDKAKAVSDALKVTKKPVNLSLIEEHQPSSSTGGSRKRAAELDTFTKAFQEECEKNRSEFKREKELDRQLITNLFRKFLEKM